MSLEDSLTEPIPLRVFLDASIISSFLKDNLTKDDISALETILISFKAKKIDLITLESTRQKINRIPKLYKTQNTTLLDFLKSVPSVDEFGLYTKLEGEEFRRLDPLYRKLIIKVDNIEAITLYQAIRNESKVVLTLNRVFLDKADELLDFKVSLLTPIELMKKLIAKSN